MIHDEAVTALAFHSGTLIVGFEDGQVKFLRKGAKKAVVAGAFHSSYVQDLKMISDDRFVTSAWLEEFIQLMWIHQLIVNRSLYLSKFIRSICNLNKQSILSVVTNSICFVSERSYKLNHNHFFRFCHQVLLMVAWVFGALQKGLLSGALMGFVVQRILFRMMLKKFANLSGLEDGDW